MSRPIIQIDPGPFDKVLMWVIYISLVVLIILPCMYFSRLPDQIPIHFGVDGTPDAFGRKATILVLPAIGLAISSLFDYLSKVPHTFNYPTPINSENAYSQYSNAIKMMRTLNSVILWGFVYITYKIIQNGLENSQGLGRFFLPIFMALTFVPIIYFAMKSFQKK